MTKLEKYLSEVEKRLQRNSFLFAGQIRDGLFKEQREDVEVLLKMVKKLRENMEAIDPEEALTPLVEKELESLIPESEEKND